MPYELKPQPGESVLLDVRFQPSRKSEPFHFGVTDQAIYLPAKKFVISGDPCFFQRVPNSDLRSIAVKDTRPYGAWLMAVIMVAAGLTMIAALLVGQSVAVPPRYYGWALALIVGGMLVPFAAKGRKHLVVVMTKGIYKWNPPFVVDKRSKQQVADIMHSIMEVCQRSGKPVLTEISE